MPERTPTVSDSDSGLPVRAEAVAFDLDGTLLDYSGVMADSVALAVRRIADAGIRVFVVSGRMPDAGEPYWRRLGLDTPLASCNGAFVGIPGQTPLVDKRLSAEAREIVLGIDQKHGVYLNYCPGGEVYTLHDDGNRAYYSAHFSPVKLAESPDAIRAFSLPSKCLCITPEEEQAKFIDIFRSGLGSLADITTSNSRFIEILPPGANKGEALKSLSEWCGIPTEKFIAVGDGMNDLPMLKTAGFAVAFTSGNPALAPHADMVIPPLWEDGADILTNRILGLGEK